MDFIKCPVGRDGTHFNFMLITSHTCAALGSVTQGDRIWWTWSSETMKDDFSLLQIKQDEVGRRSVTPQSSEINYFRYVSAQVKRI